ncbi:MAG: helicase-associated domain-containing protein [Spirochaetota bacterium]
MDTPHEVWMQSVYALSDEAFLDIARNYLGVVKTPFHKPELIKRLTSFITTAEHKHRLIELIDADDALILQAVLLLSRPTIQDLHDLLAGDKPYYLLRQAVVNLEQRLLLLQRPDKSLLLNPLVAHEIKEKIMQWPLVIDLQPEHHTDKPEGAFLFNEAGLAALFSLLQFRSVKLNSDLSLRKTSEQQITEIFHASDVQGREFFQTLLPGLQRLGMVRELSGFLRPDMEQVKRLFLALDNRQRIAHIAAACIAAMQDTETSLEPFVGVMYDILDVFCRYQCRGKKDVYRLIRLINSHHNNPVADEQQAVSCLVQLGILSESEHTYLLHRQLLSLLGHDPALTSQPAVIDSDFTVTCGPLFHAPEGAAMLAATTEIRQAGVQLVFEITKRSCRNAFDLGYSFQQLADLLEQISAHRVLPNVLQSIEHWRAEYDSLSLHTGIVLEASGPRARIIEKLPSLREHIIRQFSPQLFLFRLDTEHVWREILAQAGFEMLPSPTEGCMPIGEHTSQVTLLTEFSPLPESLQRFLEAVDRYTTNVRPFTEEAEEMKEQFYQAAREKAATQGQLEQLCMRIEKKLIISHKQLSYSFAGTTPAEAKGFDYQGKIQLVKQTIEAGEDLLELHVRTPQDETETILIMPTELQKDDTGHILIGKTMPGHHYFSKPLRKIFLLRRLKGSLYSPM